MWCYTAAGKPLSSALLASASWWLKEWRAGHNSSSSTGLFMRVCLLWINALEISQVHAHTSSPSGTVLGPLITSDSKGSRAGGSSSEPWGLPELCIPTEPLFPLCSLYLPSLCLTLIRTLDVQEGKRIHLQRLIHSQ